MGLFRNYLPLLAFAALFRDDPALRDTPHAVVRKDVEHLLAEADAASAHAPARARTEALFAVCAFVDEAILTSQWQGRTEWARVTLQRTRLGTVNAGMEFYEHCRALLREAPPVILPRPDGRPAPPTHSPAADETAPVPFSEYLRRRNRDRDAILTDVPATLAVPDVDTAEKPVSTVVPQQSAPVEEAWREEVLCLYGACLSMGFAGRYHDTAEQHLLREVALASLERAVGGRVSLHQRTLSPEAYYMPEPGAPRTRPWLSSALALAAPILGTILLYTVYEHTLDACLAQWVAALAGRF